MGYASNWNDARAASHMYVYRLRLRSRWRPPPTTTGVMPRLRRVPGNSNLFTRRLLPPHADALHQFYESKKKCVLKICTSYQGHRSIEQVSFVHAHLESVRIYSCWRWPNRSLTWLWWVVLLFRSTSYFKRVVKGTTSWVIKIRNWMYTFLMLMFTVLIRAGHNSYS